VIEMVGETDEKDKNETRKIAIALVSLVLVLFGYFSDGADCG